MTLRPYYEDSAVTIYHGDCRLILPQLPKVDLVLTDPPYGVNKAEWDSKFYLDWLELIPRLTDTFAIMSGVANLLKLPYSIEDLTYKWTLSIRISNAIHVRGAVGFGNWIPCVVYSKNGQSIYSCNQDATDIVIHGDMPEHPSPKPIDAIIWLVERLSKPNTVILDPFMGSGTTLRAAKNLGRKAIGIEICEAYCEIAAKRMSQTVFALATEAECLNSDSKAQQGALV